MFGFRPIPESEFRKSQFEKIQQGTVFSFSEKEGEIKRVCIARKKIDDQTWQVIELSPTNIRWLLNLYIQPLRSSIKFDELHNLYILIP